MEVNSENNHLLSSCSEPFTTGIKDFSIKSSVEEALFRRKIVKQFPLDVHINNLCKKLCKPYP